ncbi:MAG: hypothetical protein R2865_11740 [Deinococcales bacterium]
MRGGGIAIVEWDEVEVYNNSIKGNKSIGIGVLHLSFAVDKSQIDVPATPERNHIYNNSYENNGYDIDPSFRAMGLSGVDILWDISGADNHFDDKGVKSFRRCCLLSNWPQGLYNAYWHIWQNILKLVG